MTRADRYADGEWHAQAVGFRDAMRARVPHVGERFIVDGQDWRIVNVFAVFGESRFDAERISGGHTMRTFERVAGKLNQWRAFRHSDAAVFSL